MKIFIKTLKVLEKIIVSIISSVAIIAVGGFIFFSTYFLGTQFLNHLATLTLGDWVILLIPTILLATGFFVMHLLGDL